jgi:sec-independent protein translocase protein TatB
MFDIGWQELFILAVLAIIVIGPKDLPHAIRTITKGIRKARSMARDLQDGMDDVIREAELDDIKETIGGDGRGMAKMIEEAVDLDMDDMDLDGDLRKEMTGAVEDLKSITKPGEAEKTKTAATGDAPKTAPKTAKAKKTKADKTKAAPDASG